RALESWHAAFWTEVDRTTPSQVKMLARAIRIDWSKLPLKTAADRDWEVETIRQQYFERRALFLWAMKWSDATDPRTYNLFLQDMENAKRIGDDSIVNARAKQKQTKPSKDQGDRRLKYQLLLAWIPACLWAFTTDGMCHFLQNRYPRSQNRPYHS